METPDFGLACDVGKRFQADGCFVYDRTQVLGSNHGFLCTANDSETAARIADALNRQAPTGVVK